jgi:hypothetical protein
MTGEHAASGMVFSTKLAPLAEPIDAEDYMQVLLDRQAAWEAEHPSQGWVRPLLEWFIEPGDEKWVRLPEPAPTAKRQPTPRVYRSAESIRAELADVEARMARVAGEDCGDGAVVNLSPYSRSRAARNAGRRRFEKLDRDLERYSKLKARRDRLAAQLARAEAREAKPPNGNVSAGQTVTGTCDDGSEPETPHGRVCPGAGHARKRP